MTLLWASLTSGCTLHALLVSGLSFGADTAEMSVLSSLANCLRFSCALLTLTTLVRCCFLLRRCLSPHTYPSGTLGSPGVSQWAF